ncbi:MAG: hypothetical protein JW892_17750, partial [Anaerolineae bacterium]|nr:hypothetical protein [Anaerolineae bacterium]
ADLGLAQIAHGPSMRSQLSQPLPHPGTPAYMSPEQRTTGDYLTSASDIYTLGVVLFEMLTGRVYRNLPAGTHARALRADVPAWLDDALARMLDEKPEARPWDGAAAAACLTASGKPSPPVSAIPATPIEAPQRVAPPIRSPPAPAPVRQPSPTGSTVSAPSRKAKTPWALIAGAMLFLAIVTVGLIWMLSRAGGSKTPTTPPIIETRAPATSAPSRIQETPSGSEIDTSAPAAEAAADVEGVTVQVAINASGDVSLNIGQPYLSRVGAYDLSGGQTPATLRQEIAGRVLLVRVNQRATIYRLEEQRQVKVEVANNAAFEVTSLEYLSDGDILLELDSLTTPEAALVVSSAEYAVALCAETSFDGEQCRTMSQSFPANTEVVYATWQSTTALRDRATFTRRWSKEGQLLLETTHTAGENSRWTPADGVSYYVYLSATEGTGKTLFNAAYLPAGRYTFELLVNNRLVSRVEYEIR